MRKLRWLLAMLGIIAVLPGMGLAQDRTVVTGTVVETGTQRPLPGAAVIAGTRSAMTDVNGRFSLTLPRGAVTIKISLIGYQQATREVTVGASPMAISIEMATDPLLLDELVVTGYTQERRRFVTGAISSVKPESVKEVPVAQIQEVLRGRTPGVMVVQNSGTPGAAMTVRIRGSASINGGNDPLYVVDGVPLTQGNWSRLGGFGGQTIDAIGDLNPNEIESIEVLKDASAAAIYGSRASNGVILITTKKGISGRPEISFGGYYGTQKDWRRIDMLNARQYIDVYNEGCTNRYGINCVTFRGDPNPPTTGLNGCAAGSTGCNAVPSSVGNNMKAWRGADTDWIDQVLRTSPISSFEAAVRGGTDKVRYFVSGNVLDQEGTQSDLGYDKLNARVNLDYAPADRLSLGTNIALTRALSLRAQNDNTIQGGLANAIAMAPTVPVRDSAGNFATGFYTNPVGNIENRSASDRSVRILGNMFGQYNIIEGVSVRGAVGLDWLNQRGLRYLSPVYGGGVSTSGSGTDASEYVTKTTYEGTVNFARQLGADHSVTGVAGGSFEDNVQHGSTVSGTNFPNEFFRMLASATTITGSSDREDWGLVSYFGRLSYTWREKVTVSGNVRRDGSSRFGTNNRYGTFPSVSVNWRIGDEGFLQGQNIVQNLSVRASYGITGNQQGLGNFASRATFVGGANYMDIPGISPQRLANADLRWEKTKQTNVGTDFAVLSNRLKIAFDYYKKETEDLLYSQPLPTTTGFSSITSNIGSMENKGFDVGVTAEWFQSRGDGFNLSSSLTLSRNRNKVTSLYKDQPNLGTNSIIVGQPLGVFYGYVMDGIFQSQAEVAAHATQTVNTNPRLATAAGDIRWKDLNGDGLINTSDRQVIGNPWPDYEGGLNNTASYKGVDLSAFIQFSQGNDIFNGIRIYKDRFGSDGDNHDVRALERWTPTNPSNTEPRAIWGDPNGNTRTSSRFVEDGSYWRLKNVVLGYRLPIQASGSTASQGWAQWIGSAIGARNIRVYVQGQNLITETNYSGFDPEVNSSGNSSTTRGYDFYALPQPRTITFGFNIGF
jgi:TonB-dependent starch-binding outer membrane protein SusC